MEEVPRDSGLLPESSFLEVTSFDVAGKVRSTSLLSVVANLSLLASGPPSNFFFKTLPKIIRQDNFKIDDVTKEFINLTSNWKNILSFSDEEVFNLIKSDNLNILVDLSGYTDGNRLPVLIAKPAPIQISWCGYLQSLGLPEIDYIISDPHCIPQDLNHLYLEKIFTHLVI